MRRIFDWLAATKLRIAGIQVNRCPAQLLHAGLERKARARARFFENHHQRSVAQRPVALVGLELLLDPARTLEKIIELVAREVLELQEMLDVRLECGHGQYQSGSKKITYQHGQPRHEFTRFVRTECQSRQQTHDLVGGHVDQQARLESARNQFATRAIEFDTDHQPLTADIDDASLPGQRFRQLVPDLGTDCFGVGDQLIPLNDFDRRQSRRRRKLIPAKGRAVIAGLEQTDNNLFGFSFGITAS